MKTFTLFRIFSISLVLFLLGTAVNAQTKEEKAAMEAEMKAKQAQIELQRKQMKEQQQKTRELERLYREEAREASRARSTSRVFVPGTGIGDEPSYYIWSGGQENQSQLTIRNSFDGDTDTAEGEFDVDESTKHIRCTINGKANSGKINIKVLYPGGKVFKDLSITSSAQISFSQSLSIKEEEKKKYIGSWSYIITADKAEGSYTLSFMTH
jgi:hypothetical protein